MSGEKASDPVAAGAVDGAGPDLKAGRQGIGQANTQKEGGAQASPKGFVVRNDGRPVGVVVIGRSGKFEAWTTERKLGECDTASAAQEAVLGAAPLARQARRLRHRHRNHHSAGRAMYPDTKFAAPADTEAAHAQGAGFASISPLEQGNSRS